MLGSNVQAYVNDMVVTSVKADQLVTDLEELFAAIARYNLNLNPNVFSMSRQGSSLVSY